MPSKRQGYVKASARDDQARRVAMQIKAIDYQLMAICAGEACPLSRHVTEQLAAMQRYLRRVRYEIEIERRFDTPPIDAPGGPTLRVV